MEQISQEQKNKYKATADNLVLEATERIYDGVGSVNATIKKDDKTVASVYIDRRNKTSSVSINNDMLGDTAVTDALNSNMLGWIKQLATAPVVLPEVQPEILPDTDETQTTETTE